MANNKIVFGGEVLLDLTGDTVTPDRLADGYTAHDRSGEPIVGTMTPNKPVDVASNDAMTAIAARATENDLGKIYLFVGEDDDVFEKDALYILIKKGSGYGFQRYAIGGSGGAVVIDVTELPAGGGTPVVGKWTLAELDGVEDLTTIPPDVENIYFNTALSNEEVAKILSGFTYTNFNGVNGVCAAFGLGDITTSHGMFALIIAQLGSDYGIMGMGDSAGEFIIYATGALAAEFGGSFNGWNPEFNGTFAVNGVLIKPGETTPLGLPVDNQQEKYSGLISLTPGFEPADVDETAVYRATKKVNADVYYRYNAEDPDGYLNLKAILASKGITCEITYYVLDAYPESPEVTNLQTLNPGHVYIINDIPQVYGNMGSGNMWVTVTDMLISEGITTTDCGYTADITKETQIGTFVTYKTEVTLHYYKDGKWHGGGGSGGIVDVEELPDVNTVDEAVIYRTKSNSAQLWFKNGNNLASLEQFYAAFGGLSVTYYVVDSLPSNPVITSNTNGAYVYVVKSTGFAYSSSDGSTYSPMSLTGNPKGWISSLDEITEDGDYTLRVKGGAAYGVPMPNAEVYSISDGEWGQMLSAKAVLELNQQIETLETSVAEQAAEIETLEDTITQKDSEISTLENSIQPLRDENALLAMKLAGLELGGEGGENFARYASLKTTGTGIEITDITDTSVTSMTIPDGVTSIGANAFHSCSSLTNITIPDSVTSIGSHAFYRCSSLTNITIPNSVTSIGAGAFTECKELTDFSFPNRLTRIERSVISHCTGLTEIVIPDSVTSIGNNAFNGCRGVTEIVIPDGVTSMGDEVFLHCDGLVSVIIGNGVTSLGAGTFSDCDRLASVTIGDSVRDIAKDAFIGNYPDLTEITVTDGNTTYRSSGNCLIETASKKLIFGCNNSTIPTDGSVTSIGNNAFDYCGGLTEITIPDSVTSIGEQAFMYCFSLTSVIIPDGVTAIENNTFNSCTSLATVTIPSSVTSIGHNAFWSCSSLTEAAIPDSVTSIGASAFCSCKMLTSINIPAGVTSIDLYTFHDCTGLTTVTIPDSVTSIGDEAFYNCSSLTSINIPDGVTSIGNGAFQKCSNLTGEFIIPDGVTSIEPNTFYGCSSLTSIIIPDGVTRIEGNAFRNCSSLTSVTIPDGVPSIADYTFSGCSGLTEVIIGNGVTDIGLRAFEECAGLTSVTIGSSVTSIVTYAFYNCSSLTDITIPDSVTSIGYQAFSNCTSMQYYDFTSHTAVPTLSTNTFTNIPSTCEIRVPAALYDEWVAATNWSEYASNIVAV